MSLRVHELRRMEQVLGVDLYLGMVVGIVVGMMPRMGVRPVIFRTRTLTSCCRRCSTCLVRRRGALRNRLTPVLKAGVPDVHD